jgi:hypothetical protein
LETNENEEVLIEDPKAVLSALERAKSDAKKFREEKESLSNDIENKQGLIAKFSEKLLREQMVKAISKEGIAEPERVLRFVDFNGLSLDDDMNALGVEDQLEKLKADLPEIFDAKLRVGGKADAAIKASVSTEYSATQLQAAKILGKL